MDKHKDVNMLQSRDVEGSIEANEDKLAKLMLVILNRLEV
jgi:hypothetical protein